MEIIPFPKLIGKNCLTIGKWISTSLYQSMSQTATREKPAQNMEGLTGNISLSVIALVTEEHEIHWDH